MKNPLKRGTAVLLLDPTRSKVWMGTRVQARDYNGSLACPGGEIDPGETPIIAVLRELQEETGLEFKRKDLHKLGVTREVKPTENWNTHWFVVHLTGDQKPKDLEPERLGPWKLVQLGNIETANLYPGTKVILPKLFDYLDSLPPTNIAAAYPCGLCAVDAAVVRKIGTVFEVILGKKPGRDKWCFPGGFFDVAKDNSDEDAVIREVSEEVPGTQVEPALDYICSHKVDDPRYRRDKDKIVTHMFKAQYSATNTEVIKAGDDLAEVCWFTLKPSDSTAEYESPIAREDILVGEHHYLLGRLRKHLNIP